MKKLAVAGLVAVVLTLVGCGWHDHGHGNINGTWTAILSDSDFSFGTSVVVNGDGTLTARGRSTEKSRAVTRCAATERWCHLLASSGRKPPE
jgi:outer membrane lipopolysaccharide assembly protein LptE/RlpB